MPTVNRVSVRVVPDTKGFRETLQKFLQKTERSMSLALQVDADTRKASESLAELSRERDATVNADADTKAAAGKLDALSRTRTAGIRINLKGIGPALARVGLVSAAVSGIAPLALSSSAGLLTMGGALASLSALAAPLPGLLAAGGVAAGVFVIALRNAGTELASLNPLWKTLNGTIQTNFWGAAKKPILDLVNSVFPQLKTGLTGVSSALGTWSGSVASSFQKAFGGGAITGMMGKLSTAIRNSTAGTDAFAAAIATLGTFGAAYLPAIGTAFSTIAAKFNGWIQQVASDGTLQSWVSTAMTVLGQLGQVFQSTIGIIGGLASAATSAGSGGMATLAGALTTISGIVNSAGFQATLGSIFAGASAGASALGAALGPIGSMLAALPIGPILSTLGSTLGQVASGIAAALSAPGVGAGLLAAINGISQGLLSLLPALTPLAAALAPVLSLMGALASTVGPILAQTLTALAPILANLANFLIPFAPAILAIVAAITAWNIATTVMGAVMKIAAAAQLALNLVMDANPIGIIIVAIAALVAGLIYFFTQTKLGQQVWANITSFIGTAIGKIGSFIGTIATTTANVFSNIGSVIRGTFNGVVGFIKSIINDVINVVNGAIGSINSITSKVGIPSIPKIPHLATGADIAASQGGTLAVLGEGGQAETVSNLGLTNRMLAATTKLAEQALGGAGQTVNMTNNITQPEDPTIIAWKVGREAARALAGKI